MDTTAFCISTIGVVLTGLCVLSCFGILYEYERGLVFRRAVKPGWKRS
jgi:hypothetical protein